MLLNIDGSGYLQRKGQKENLKVPMSFIEGDLIVVTRGSANVLHFSAGEMTIKSGESFVIPAFDFDMGEDIFAYANSNEGSALNETGSSYFLRGEQNAFPTRSRIINGEIAQVYIPNFAEIEDPQIYVREYESQKELYNKKITDSIIVLDKVRFKKGKLYSWMVVSKNKMPALGTIEVLSAEEAYDLNKSFEYNTHFDYIDAIVYYTKNDFIFKAIQVINRAQNIYPEISIYSYLKTHVFLN